MSVVMGLIVLALLGAILYLCFELVQQTKRQNSQIEQLLTGLDGTGLDPQVQKLMGEIHAAMASGSWEPPENLLDEIKAAIRADRSQENRQIITEALEQVAALSRKQSRELIEQIQTLAVQDGQVQDSGALRLALEQLHEQSRQHNEQAGPADPRGAEHRQARCATRELRPETYRDRLPDPRE